jgi:type III secretion protein L
MGTFHIERANLGDLPKGPGRRILKPDDAGAWQEGEKFLAAARDEAERVRDDARRAYADEHERGYAEGRAAGEAEAARLVAETVIDVDRYLATLEREVALLAVDIVRRVLGELDVGELVARAARQAIADLRRAKQLRLCVHPAAADAVRREVETLMRGAATGLLVEVEADPARSPDACVVVSDVAVVDAGIETQLAALALALARDRETRR